MKKHMVYFVVGGPTSFESNSQRITEVSFKYVTLRGNFMTMMTGLCGKHESTWSGSSLVEVRTRCVGSDLGKSASVTTITPYFMC